MSSLAAVIDFPVRHEDDGQLEHDIVFELATADGGTRATLEFAEARR
jgi:hypothetical protein